MQKIYSVGIKMKEVVSMCYAILYRQLKTIEINEA